jgi:pimeloyl-ACP methyl ester carboxylesterase
MSHIEISGIGIEYRLLGAPNAPAIALTPGGRLGMNSPGLLELGERLAAGGKRVLLWDRPNCGASDICFDGDSESELQASVLIGLIRSLQLGPAALAGGSAGARASLIAAIRDPAVASHLVQWWISGGTISLLMLGSTYCCESAIAASLGGMSAVAALPAWAEQLKSNPRNRGILLRQDPQRFVAKMECWARAFIPSATSPVPCLTLEDLARIQVPVLMFRASKADIVHPSAVTEQLHELIGHSELADPPWSEGAYLERMINSARTGAGFFLDWPLLAAQILEFISR